MTGGDYETINQRQSYVQKSGEEWENFVMGTVNTELGLRHSKLKVIKGKFIKKNSSLWEKLAIPVGELRNQRKIWGDIDLVVVNKKLDLLAVISCKTSLHGRFSETLFYTVVLKQQIPGLRVVFATPDKGRQQRKQWQSEWGTEEFPTKDRLLGAHYLDGIYIYNEKTKLGGIIRSLNDLAKDLVSWFESK